MRPRLSALLALTCVMFLAGCARSPAGLLANNAPAQTIYSEITVAGNINPAYYYFFALDDSGNQGLGPVPVATGTGFGNGWGTLSPVSANTIPTPPPFYVEVHNGTAEQYYEIPIISPTTGQITGYTAQSAGPPYRWQVMAADNTPALTGPNLSVEVDTSLIMPPGGPALPAFVNVNWITVQQIAQSPQNIGASQLPYDGFGGTNSGNGYIMIPLGASSTTISGVNGVPGQAINTSPAASLPDINLVNWRIEDRLNQ